MLSDNLLDALSEINNAIRCDFSFTEEVEENVEIWDGRGLHWAYKLESGKKNGFLFYSDGDLKETLETNPRDITICKVKKTYDNTGESHLMLVDEDNCGAIFDNDLEYTDEGLIDELEQMATTKEFAEMTEE